MGRLLHWPRGLGITSMQVLSGPRTVGGASTQSLGGFQQSVSSPFGLWRLGLTFGNMKGKWARTHRGFIASLHGGANAVRVPIIDMDMMKPDEVGVNGVYADQPWSNGQRWSNSNSSTGVLWGRSYPKSLVAGTFAKGAIQIALSNQYWGGSLSVGDYIGFEPFHFGLYVITEVLGSGNYRSWPPLRKDVSNTSYATLKPTIVMRLESEGAANINRDLNAASSLSATFVEVLDEDVRRHFS